MTGRDFRKLVLKNEPLMRELYKRGYLNRSLLEDVELADLYKKGGVTYKDIAFRANIDISRIHKRIKRCM